MANRILKESICTSESLRHLSWFDETVFYRLIVNCDDYGRFDAREDLIKGRLFPLKRDVTLASIKSALKALESEGIITLYEHEGRPYLELVNWTKHQNVRNKKSKYPSPKGDEKAIDCN